jgi:predicted transposase/invertase (TIGR01784 family)
MSDSDESKNLNEQALDKLIEEKLIAIAQYSPESEKIYRDILAKKRLVSLKTDYVFKAVFNPDIHKERLSRFLSRIIGVPMNVVGAADPQSWQKTGNSKKSTIDILAKLEDGEYAIIEIQVDKLECMTQRSALYSSEVLVRQYTVEEGQKKKDFNYEKLRTVYTVVLMYESPAAFAVRPRYLHRFSQTDEFDPDFKPNFLQRYVFVELIKFKKQIAIAKKAKTQITTEQITTELEEDVELTNWLKFIADDKIKSKETLAKLDPEYKKMYEELKRMSVNKTELFRLLDEELYELDRISERNQALEEGRRQVSAAADRKVEAADRKVKAADRKAKAADRKAKAADRKAKADIKKAEAEAAKKAEVERDNAIKNLIKHNMSLQIIAQSYEIPLELVEQIAKE